MAVALALPRHALPDATFAAVVARLGRRAVVHLVFGSPGGRPTTAQVGAALEELGVPRTSEAAHAGNPEHGTLMSRRDATGRCASACSGATKPTRSSWRSCGASCCTRTAGPACTSPVWRTSSTRPTRCCSPSAARRARAPRSSSPGAPGPSAALLVDTTARRDESGDADPADVSDAVLDEVWQQTGVARRERVAHGALNAGHIVVEGGAATIVDFEASSTAATDPRSPRTSPSSS